MSKKSLKMAVALLLVLMPFITAGLWALWHETTFDVFAPGNSNYRAVADLYGKSDICRDKESFLGQYALTCTSIYSFCSTDPPNIEQDEEYPVDHTETCATYMHATKPFRNLFIPSVIVSIIASGVGIALLASGLKPGRSFIKKKRI